MASTIPQDELEEILSLIPPERLFEKTINATYPLPLRLKMGKFKKDYIRQTDPAGRKLVFRTQVLPVVFSYWKANGDTPVNNEDSGQRIKIVAAYIRNNWRPLVTDHGNMKTRVRFTAADYIWREKRELVDAEIREMLGIEEVDYAVPEVFRSRTTAIKEVLESMTVGEREEVDAKVEMHKKEGLPPDMQKRLASTRLDQRIREFQEDRWRDMGALILSFVVYKSLDGAWVVDRYDDIAKTMEVSGQSFVDMNRDKVNEVKRLLITYVKSLHQTRTATANIQPPVTPPNVVRIQISEEGFPILPTTAKFDSMNKADLTDCIRTYLNAHYRLASRSKRSVPFKAIQADNSRFVDQKYLPVDVVMKEAKNMQKEDVISFLDHVMERQRTYGFQDAFRFKIMIRKQKEYPSKYPEEPPPKISKSSRSREKREKSSKRNRKSDMVERKNRLQKRGTAVENEIDDGVIDPVLLQIDAEMRANRDSVDMFHEEAAAVNRKGKGKGKEVGVGEDVGIEDNTFQGAPCLRPDFHENTINSPAAAITFNTTPAAVECTIDSSSKRLLPIVQDIALHQALPVVEEDIPPSITSDVIISRKNTRKQKKVGRSDAIALEEAKKILQNVNKTRR